MCSLIFKHTLVLSKVLRRLLLKVKHRHSALPNRGVTLPANSVKRVQWKKNIFAVSTLCDYGKYIMFVYNFIHLFLFSLFRHELRTCLDCLCRFS